MDMVICVDGSGGFVLPEGHILQIASTDDRGEPVVIRLSVPGTSGATFRVRSITRAADEVIFDVVPAGTEGGVAAAPVVGYPWVDLQNAEQQRLLEEEQALTGSPAVGGWGQESHREHYTRRRAEIRRLRAQQS